MRYHMSYPVVISPLGDDVDSFMVACLAGDTSHFVRNEDGHLVVRYPSMDPDVFNAILAKAVEACRSQASALISRYGAERVGVALGGCDYNSQNATREHASFLATGTFGDYHVDFQNPYHPVEKVAAGLGLEGPSFAVATACSSGNVAAIRAMDLIAAGEVDAMLVGGIDFASDIITAGFHSLSAISDERVDPFSRNRKGTTLGDGAALYFISRDKVFDFPVMITGFGESSDGYNMTSPDPQGSAVIDIYHRALAMAVRRPEDIGYVNLHGTGTRVNDAMEAQVISQVFPHGVKVSSTKSITGHTLGAAGAFGTVISAMCLASSQPCLLPPHVFDGELDETIPQLDFVKAGQRCEIHAAISNAFAFGGSNSLLLMEVEG